MTLESPRPADIRQANAVSCIQTWRGASEPLTIAEIAQRTGLSRPTVDAVLTSLERQGLVSELAADNSGSQGGRPARRFRFESLSAVVAGIEAAPRSVTVLLANLRGTIIARTTKRVDEGLTAIERLGVVVDAVGQALSDADIPATRLRAACVGVSGIIGHDGKISRSYFVPDWNNTDIAARLAQKLGCRVFLENDIKLAAYAEHHLGAAQLTRDSLFFHIGQQIAFAITIDGRIHQGAHRSAGELASLRGMRWTTNAVRGELVWSSAPTFADVVRAAQEGDEAAEQEISEFTSEIAGRVATVALVIDPDLIVVGGEFSTSAAFMERLRVQIDRFMLLDNKAHAVASSLRGDGTIIGAVALAFQECSEQLYSTPGVPVPELSMSGFSMPDDGTAA